MGEMFRGSQDLFPEWERQMWEEQFMRGRQMLGAETDASAATEETGRLKEPNPVSGDIDSRVDWEQFHRDIVPDPDPNDHGFDGTLPI